MEDRGLRGVCVRIVFGESSSSSSLEGKQQENMMNDVLLIDPSSNNIL